MGRQLRHVALDFNWPLNKVYDGFLNPHYGHSRECALRGGSGLSPAGRYFQAQWYGRSHHLSPADVAALVVAQRLQPGSTAAQVNARSIADALLRDAINCHVCVEARCAREGLPAFCAACAGDGYEWDSQDDKAAAEAWEQTEPPAGDGWQMWETVSEGSPISPVFASAAELVAWLGEHEEPKDTAAWLRMIEAGG